MRTLIIPDVHGSTLWKLRVNTEPHDRVVFLGDYFDSFHFTTDEQINNFLDILEYKKTSGKEVIMLVGNHDHHYIVGDTGTSGYQEVGHFHIDPVIKANMEHLQMAYRFDNFLCTHAGVSETFMNERFGDWDVDSIVDRLNELFEFQPFDFIFNGFDPYGDDPEQSPIWIRPRSLMKDSKNIKKAGIIQIVGHTHVDKIDRGKATGGKYYFVDCSQEHLVITDGVVEIKKTH